MSEPISIKEAARRLGVKPKEIRRRIKAGQLDGLVRLPSGLGGFPPPLADNPNFPGYNRGLDPAAGAAPSEGRGLGAPGTAGYVGQVGAGGLGGGSVPAAMGGQNALAGGAGTAAAVGMTGAASGAGAAGEASTADQKDAQIQRLEEIVRLLREDAEARRREVQELRTLLQEYRRESPAPSATPVQPLAAPGPAPQAAASLPMSEDATPDDVKALPAGVEDEVEVEADELEAEATFDWQAYDAESDQLKATMGRLQSLLEQLDQAEDESEVSATQVSRTPAPIASPAVAPSPQPAPALAAPPIVPASPESVLSLPAEANEAEPEPAPPETATAPGPVPVPQEAAATTAQEAAGGAVRPRQARPVTLGRGTAAASAAPEAEDGSNVPTGAAILKRREAMGISREALAAASGLSWGLITEVERGRRRDPRSRERVAEALEAMKQRAGG